MTSTQVATTCKWGACTRRAIYTVTEQPAGGTITTQPMCSQHRIATANEGWSYGAIVTWVKL